VKATTSTAPMARRSNLDPNAASARPSRGHVLRGEWLRHECRPADPREQLRTAHEMSRRWGRPIAARAGRALQATRRANPQTNGRDPRGSHRAGGWRARLCRRRRSARSPRTEPRFGPPPPRRERGPRSERAGDHATGRDQSYEAAACLTGARVVHRVERPLSGPCPLRQPTPPAATVGADRPHVLWPESVVRGRRRVG
jgi:hypothetical protein